MGASLLVLTSDLVSQAVLDDYVVELGGAILSTGPALDDGTGAVWPYAETRGIDMPSAARPNAMAAELLGGEVRTMVVLELSSDPGSYPLAARFIEHLTRRHPCVLDVSSCCARVLTAAQALPRLRAGMDPDPPCATHAPLA